MERVVFMPVENTQGTCSADSNLSFQVHTKLLVYAEDVVLLGDNKEILRANKHTLLSNTKKLGLEVNINKTK